MRLEFLGAAHTVTGSCYLLETGEDRYLIDCGMFQGAKRIREYNYEEFAFNPADIDGMLLTHAHVDHCGLVPKLVREGFKGTVYATQATCDLVRIMLPDSAHIQESDAELMNRKGRRRGDEPTQPLLRDPTIIHGADFVITESTYGDRLHQLYDKETALIEIVNETMDRGGNLIIPSFAVGRTQTLLYYFYRLHCEGRLDPDIPIIIDSPLAINATRVFLKNFRDFDEESLKVFGKEGKVPNFAQVHLCETAAESRAFNSSEGSAIIISASGMADAGRVLHHLKHNLWRPESTILFVGYQAEGCLGRRLIDGITRVRVLGEEIAVKAQIKSLDGFSAHADANQIMSWLGEIRDPKPAKIFIVHGEAPAQEALKSRIQKELGIECYIPFRGDLAKISGRASEIIPSNIPSVSVEKEMEDVLRDFDSDYRQLRRRVMQYVVRQPKMMEPVIKVMSKARNYMRKLFTPFNI